MKRSLHIVLVLLVAAACQGPRVIPKDTLVDIYTDMFLADQMVREENIPRAQMDTMLLYEAVFEKYGYDTDDYMHTLRENLRDPERFAKVFDAVAKRLEAEVDALDKLIELQHREEDRLQKQYPEVEMMLAPFSKGSFYAGAARFDRDTSRFGAWYRLVPAQEDTLMVPVDSVEARALRDSLKAADTLKVDLPAKDGLKPEKPLRALPAPVLLPRGRQMAPKIHQKDIIAAEEVAEEEAVEEPVK